jgi:asparagine synthase (glutamine-hydrolysing)
MARLVARHFGTRHHEVVLDIDVLGGLEAMVRGFDEPFGSPTALLSSALARFTREHVTVALAGDGGDELFGGYPRYRGMLLAERTDVVPEGVFRIGETMVRGNEAAVARSYRRWARQFLAAARLSPAQRYARWVGYAAAVERDGWYTEDLRARIVAGGREDPVAAAFSRPLQGDAVERAAYADLHGFLPDNVLRGSDRMSMAWALELRVPLCDPRLVELAMQIPSRHRVGVLASKRVLRRIARGFLPPAIVGRGKLGFNAPLGVWLRRDLDRLVGEWLAPHVVARRGWFEPGAIAALVREHREGSRDHGLRLWSLIVLEQWARIWC